MGKREKVGTVRKNKGKERKTGKENKVRGDLRKLSYRDILILVFHKAT